MPSFSSSAHTYSGLSASASSRCLNGLCESLLDVYVKSLTYLYSPCMVFNNVTSLPLLLLTSLGDTGTLKPLLGDGDDMDELLSRGKVYLLIHALVCNLTRFGFGPCKLYLFSRSSAMLTL